MRLRRGFAFDFDLGEREGEPLVKTAGACTNVALGWDYEEPDGCVPVSVKMAPTINY